ncbi:MAG: ABC transporter permease subunit [Opitutaceae bacterium]|nr:ABC transporter permease subunit [Opitutaceae bacterium]
MNWPHIFAVYGKELRDMLRDRRTLISMIVVPTLIMPGLLALVATISVKVTQDAAAAIPNVALIGGADSPRLVAALRAHGKVSMVAAGDGWRERIAAKTLRAAVEIPPDFDRAVERGEPATVRIYNYVGELRSGAAVGELQRFFRAYGDTIVMARLAARGLPPTAIVPFDVKPENVAPPAKVGGNIVGGLIPYLFLMLAFVGAMYPAMDLAAGEKERGTMETILCSPVARIDLVLGKFLTILTASLGTVACSLVAMGLTLAIGGPLLAQKIAGGSGAAARRSAEQITALTTIDPLGLVGVLGLVVPMAVLFSAGLFTLSLFAKSFKEAQTYTSPLIIVILLPAIIGLLPGVELNARLALVPILNVSLAGKELVSGAWPWGYLALIFGSSCAYAAIAVALAVRTFGRESVLFRA